MTDDDSTNLEVFEAAIATIRARFPALECTAIGRAEVEFPPQSGLDFPVHLGLEYDEFFIACGTLWHGHFPCESEDFLSRYVEIVTGLISGEYRLLVNSVLGRETAAHLQRPVEGGHWRTVQTLGSFWALVPWKRTQRVVRNGG